MKRKDVYSVLFFIIIIVTIVILSVKNDKNFNEEKYLEVRKTEKRDSLILEQLKGLKIRVNKINTQVDSILENQRSLSNMECLHYENIKQSLNYRRTMWR